MYLKNYLEQNEHLIRLIVSYSKVFAICNCELLSQDFQSFKPSSTHKDILFCINTTNLLGFFLISHQDINLLPSHSTPSGNSVSNLFFISLAISKLLPPCFSK